MRERPDPGLAEILKSWQSRRRPGIAATAIVLTAALGLGTVVLSSGKQPADWEALDRYLHTQVAETDRVAAPHIERPVAWRYPALNRRRAALDDLPPRSAWPGDSPRLHLIESRYTTSQQQRMIAEALAAARSAETVEVGDFRVYLLAFQ